MKQLLCLAIIGLSVLPAIAQTKRNVRLKHELDSLYEVDQRYRAMFFDARINRNPDSLATALAVPKAVLNTTIKGLMLRTDASNLVRAQAILKQYGYPGKSLVGTPTNEAVWHIIQHNPATIPQYLPLLKAAAEKGELPFTRYATMLDRQLMDEGKEQLYGTQAKGYNGQPPFFWPIQQPTQVNQRRKQAGFDTTVEEYAVKLGVPYRALTLAEVAQMAK